MVSIDDLEIAEVVCECGDEVTFLRSAATSADQSDSAYVLCEVLAAYVDRGCDCTVTYYRYLTAPFVTPSTRAAGAAELLDGSFDVITLVAPFTYPIWRSLHRETSGRITLDFPEQLNA
jgi:pseudaminic acid cytidylyltransferase